MRVRVSFIIPTLDEQDHVAAAIENAASAGASEVIVVDGGSQDQTQSIAAELNCTLIQSAAGRAIQMNAGAAIASGDVVLFMHCDNRLSVTASQQIQAAFQQSDTAWGGFEQRIDASGFAYRWLERGNAFRARYQKLVYGDQGLFVSRELFTDVGGFPEVQLMEDFALSQRLSKISLPALLPGPISVSPRRWRQNGVLAQTTRNWFIATAYRAGVSPERLAKWYDA